MSKRVFTLRTGVWVGLVALALFSFPFTVAALQHQPPPPVTDSTVDQPKAEIEGHVPENAVQEDIQVFREKPTAPERNDAVPCGETVAEMASGTPNTSVVYKLGKLLNDPADYLGKTITVDGEMHRQFTERVFTIEDSGFIQDRDMLVISMSPMSESVIPLQGSFDRGKNVRVTGVLRPYDRGKLECLFGPLALESREGHSFTKNPVLIIGYKEPAKPVASNVELPPIVLQKPEPTMPPAVTEPESTPAPPAAAPAPSTEQQPATTPEKPKEALPRTASSLPLFAVAGGLFLLAGFSARFVARKRED